MEERGQQHIPWGRDNQQEAANRHLESGLKLEVQEPTCLAERGGCKHALTGEVQGRRKEEEEGEWEGQAEHSHPRACSGSRLRHSEEDRLHSKKTQQGTSTEQGTVQQFLFGSQDRSQHTARS